MNEAVLEASIALRVLYPRQACHAEGPRRADLFPHDIGNAIRRGTGTASERAELLFDGLALVRLVRPSLDTLARAQAHQARLTSYDAAYVALAQHLRAPLWTADALILDAVPDVATTTAALSRGTRA